MFDLIAELTQFNLVIRLSKVQQSAFFMFHTVAVVFLKRQQDMLSGVVVLSFWLSGEVQMCI